MRLDVYLSENSLCKSRAAAQELIKAGSVLVDKKVCRKCSFDISGQTVEISGELPRYVGRGGQKLERALELFDIDLKGKTCLDVGASTGGFTDCMLQNGALRVTALDVGTAQLDEKLKSDSRVVSLENTDIRDYFPEEKAEFIAADVSFISLKLVLPHIFRLLSSGGEAVALIKPQFEVGGAVFAGRKALSKKGVVNDEKIRLKVVEDIKTAALEQGFSIKASAESPIKGGSGNVEYLLALRKEQK